MPPTGPDLGSDPFGDWDASYVLGALSPAERREFEEHLATCAECQTSIAELAGMPGLLAQLPPGDAAALAKSADLDVDASPTGGPDSGDPSASDISVPATLLPGVVRLDRQRRQLLQTVMGLAAALVLLAGLVGVAAVHGQFALSRSSSPYRLAFSPVVPTTITAVVDVVPHATGTELRVECQYPSDSPGQPYEQRDYAIVVTDVAGRSTPIRTWTARPNRLMTPEATTPLPVNKIAAVEIRPVNSPQAVLRATLR